MAVALLHFLEGADGRALIHKTTVRIALRRIHIPRMLSFSHQVGSVFTSLQIYLAEPEMTPDPLSEYLTDMQSYMYLCR